jgi:[acyl-carrier-protein] S-malonyltransferase
MGKDLYEEHPLARGYFERANDILGYNLSEVMFHGSDEDLRQTRITQPSVFLFSYIKTKIPGVEFKPDAVAGHSLGEFTALTAAGSLSFEDGLQLVGLRATAMQEACEVNPGTMAAIVGLEDDVVEEVCRNIKDEIVIPANYNCPGQLVISGSIRGVEIAIELLVEQGARRAIPLPVGGAFHSPLMKSAEDKLAKRIQSLEFHEPSCPIYQNYSALPTRDVDEIKDNLIKQLTSPVKWTQTMRKMLDDNFVEFTEVGARVLSGFVKRLDRTIPTESI